MKPDSDPAYFDWLISPDGGSFAAVRERGTGAMVAKFQQGIRPTKPPLRPLGGGLSLASAGARKEAPALTSNSCAVRVLLRKDFRGQTILYGSRPRARKSP